MNIDKDNRVHYLVASIIGLTAASLIAGWLLYYTSVGSMMPPGLKIFMCAVSYAAGLAWVWINRPGRRGNAKQDR